MYDRILVPLDGSPEAEDALAHARSIASRFRSELVLIRVDAPIPNLPESRYPPQIETAAASYLRRVAEPMILKQMKIRSIVTFGDPVREILGCIDRQRIDLVVIAAERDRGPFGRGVAARLARQAQVPVMLVRPTARSS